MKCKKLSLVVLSLSLAISPAFCGWSFLDSSKSDSMELKSPSLEESSQVPKNENSQEVLEEFPVEKSVQVLTVAPITTTSEEEKTKFLNSLEKNEQGIKNLSTKLSEWENSSFLSKDKNLQEFNQELLNLKTNLMYSNLNPESIEQLLTDYDKEVYDLDKEISRIHLGLGASYLYSQGNHGVALDTYLRKNNVYVNGSVAYSIDETTFKTEFDTDKLSYKVGIGVEF